MLPLPACTSLVACCILGCTLIASWMHLNQPTQAVSANSTKHGPFLSPVTFLMYLHATCLQADLQPWRRLHTPAQQTSGTPAVSVNFCFRKQIRMPNDKLPKKLVFGGGKGLCPPGCPRCKMSDVALHVCQHCHINRPHGSSQTRLLRRATTCPAHT